MKTFVSNSASLDREDLSISLRHVSADHKQLVSQRLLRQNILKLQGQRLYEPGFVEQSVISVSFWRSPYILRLKNTRGSNPDATQADSVSTAQTVERKVRRTFRWVTSPNCSYRMFWSKRRRRRRLRARAKVT